ncbi:hypothetical protein K492DRAFT_172311 [Lichtheimia hyalospora FSU 10163]|nr:hypothetical protein K492DRAFT_172311 [Lichtheimia hyalospora FSU 10163]
MSGYDSANEYVRPRRRYPRNISQDDGASSDPYEYQLQSPPRHRKSKRRGHKQSVRSNVRRRPSRRQQQPTVAWQPDHQDMDDDDDFMNGYPYLPFPFPPPPPHLVGHDGFYNHEEFDPYEEEAMLHLDEMGRLPPPPPPPHPFAGFGPMMPPPPFPPFNMIPPPPDEYFLDEDPNDDQDAISDDDYNNRPMAPAPPFLDEHVPPPGFLPPLPRLGPLPPPIPFVDHNLVRPKRSRSLPARKSRIPSKASEILHRNNSNNSRVHRKRHPSLHRRNSVSSSPGARRSTQQHEPLPHHAASAPGSPVELYSPSMDDQFHDALSHQEEDQHSPHRHPIPRRRSIHVIPSMTPHPPPPPPHPITMLGRRHSVYDAGGNNEMFPPQPLPPPPPMAPLAAMGLRHDMGDEVPSNNSSAPGTPWMPASYFSSPAMPPAPHTQPPMMPPPSGTTAQAGMGMLPSTFGPPMNPFMMGRPPLPPMPMMSMMGGAGNNLPGMLDDGDGFPPIGGGGGMNPMMGGPMMGENMMGQGAFGGGPSSMHGGNPMNSMQHGGNQHMKDRDMQGGGGGGGGDFDMGGPPSNSRANSSMGHHHHHHSESGAHPGMSSNHHGGSMMPSSSMMGNNNSGGGSMMPPPPQHHMMMGPMGPGSGGRPPMRRKSWLGGLFGGGEGSKAAMMDRHMWDRNSMVPLEDALGHMSLGPSNGESPSSMRSFGSGLSRKSSNKISNKAQQLQRFPGIWCYRPRNMMMHQGAGGDEENGGGNVWAPFSVNNQRKLHRMIDMGAGHLPSSTISLDREEKLSGTIHLCPRNMIAYHFRSLLSGRPEILDVQYIPTHDSQFVVRPEHDMAAGAGGRPPPPAGPGMASKLIGSMFGP